MRFPIRVGSKPHAATLLVALIVVLILAVSLIPAQAYPCDAFPAANTAPVNHEMPVVVAADESWRQAYGVRAEAASRDLIADVNSILQPTGIRLTVADYVTWRSQPNENSMSEMLAHLDDAVPSQPGEFVIGLTGEQISRVDGIAHIGHVHIVARRHPDQPQLDGIVVAHEIGHLLGADHHECDHDYRCIMAPKGFAQPARWCAGHVLEMQIGAADMLGA